MSSFELRYHQNSKDNDSNKSNNDYSTTSQQHAVPLCLTSDVQLRFLCPEDLEEVRNNENETFPPQILLFLKLFTLSFVLFLFSFQFVGANSVPGLVPY